MNAEQFDTLTRLWADAPTRREFVMRVGALVVYGALGRIGVPSRWLPPPKDERCLWGNREGMRCGHCGTCQRGQCLMTARDPCPRWGSEFASVGLTGSICARCDPKTLECRPCSKGQHCCKQETCCDEPCSKDGLCCPKSKKCGDTCCEGCEECVDGKCQKPKSPAEVCPPNFELIDGCCVCMPGLCEGQCCKDPDVCVEGKCCPPCPDSTAVCCDGLVCCRDRCQEPDKPCCACWEDISAEEGEAVVERAKKVAKTVKDKDLPYKMDPQQDPNLEPTHLDCTMFVHFALGKEMLDDMYKGKKRLDSRQLAGNCHFRRLGPNETPRAGDVVAQQRQEEGVDVTPEDVQHTGIATGVGRSNGLQVGIAMGTKNGPQGRAKADSLWGPRRDGGWFDGGDQRQFYRPQRRKPGCKD
jgi:hypothetical protein